METEELQSTVKKIRIGYADIFLEDFEPGQGKITISDAVNKRNYSYFWGAMGSDIATFIKRINEDYFTDKLLGIREAQNFSSRKTFAKVREHIKTFLPWYEHKEFQKELREELNNFQRDCDNDRDFVNGFYYVVDRLPWYEIDNEFVRKYIREDFEEMAKEPWHFIDTEESRESKDLKVLFKKLQKQL